MMTKPSTPDTSIRYVADAINLLKLDGQDIHDIAVSVDMGELEYVGPGQSLWAYLMILTDLYRDSASYILSEACVILGWPVTS